MAKRSQRGTPGGGDEVAESSRRSLNEPSLKATLWDAANTLRGSAVDRTDWKG